MADQHDETITLTSMELAVVTDVLRRVQHKDPVEFPGAGRPEFATAVAKLDNAFGASLGDPSGLAHSRKLEAREGQ